MIVYNIIFFRLYLTNIGPVAIGNYTCRSSISNVFQTFQVSLGKHAQHNLVKPRPLGPIYRAMKLKTSSEYHLVARVESMLIQGH